ncbi:hypothetical protein BDY19DRAFT_935557 [Irpex rosettiformis]|uniref:Uncharacterized protein n=1 Tax=Irpex rosettiformis TaxID=378272 RepID=A0ACB8U8F5_9APHY|nr:hypothetical protein BDY19DRAFT_935557 [Irpex rosettiformis]
MYPLLTLQCAALFAEAVVYGIYILTFSVTIIFLLRRRRSSKTHGLLAAVTIVMFLLSTACMALLVSSVLRHVQSGIIGVGLALRDPAYPEPYLQIIIECLNCILGDSIIIWRAWVLWNRNKVVLAVPAVLLVAALACNIGLCIAAFMEPSGTVTFSTPRVQHWAAGALGLTFIANIWGVVLVVLRFRTYQKQIAGSLPSNGSSSTMSPVTILLFLVETGILYCCTLLAVAITLIIRTPGLNVMLDLLAQFTGLYPTLIVFFVAVWKSHQGSTAVAGRSFFLTQAGDSDERTRHSAMVFAPGVTAATSFTNSELIAGHDEVTIKISV